MRGLHKGISLLALTLALGGCFSTGGGSSTSFVPTAPVVSPPPPPPEPEPEPVYERFTKISEMKRDANTKLVGIGQEVGYTFGSNTTEDDPATPEDETVYEPLAAEQSDGVKLIDVDYDVNHDGQVDGFTVYGPKTTRTWDIDPAGMAGIDRTSTNVGLYGDDSIYALSSLDGGYEYQSFGVWSTGRGSDKGTQGSFSVGAATDIAKVQDKGSAVFTGQALGAYVDGNNGQFVSNADARLEADFADRIVYFETANTKLTDVGTAVSNDAPLFDMAGSMTYTDANSMSGKVAAKNGLSGTLDGQFYGPDAQEIGGVFTLNKGSEENELHESFTGSFGAKR